MRRRLTEQERAQLVERYVSEPIGMIALAAEFGVCRDTVRAVLRKAGADTSISARVSMQYAAGARPTRAGAKWSDESRARASAARRGRVRTLGFRFSDESKQRMSESRRAYFAANPDAMEEFKRRTAARVAERRLDPSERRARARTREAAKRMLHRLLQRANLRKDARIHEMLGYTAAELRSHLEAQFTDLMGWDRPGSFHIDHVVPVRVFVERGIHDPAIVNALANLRPLPPRVNQSKSGRYAGDFDADLAAILRSIGRPLQQAA